MDLQKAFESTMRRFPHPCDDIDSVESSGFWQRWSLADAEAETNDLSRRGQLVLHEHRFTRCYERDEPGDDRYKAEAYPRNHWGYQVTQSTLTSADTEASASSPA